MEEKMVLFTVHRKDGLRIGMGLESDAENAAKKGKSQAEAFGNGATFKVW